MYGMSCQAFTHRTMSCSVIPAFASAWTSWSPTKRLPRFPSPRACATSEGGPAIVATSRWARTVVVGLGLCPFAGTALSSGGVRFREYSATTELDASICIRSEIAHLLSTDAKSLTTTLVVMPEFARHDFLRWYELTEELENDIEMDETLVDKVMLACFHPMHTWGGMDRNDAAHFDRRAPHPTVNILRAEQVDEAVREGKTEGILHRNQKILHDIGYEGMENMYRALKS